jgi:hypothetical protein
LRWFRAYLLGWDTFPALAAIVAPLAGVDDGWLFSLDASETALYVSVLFPWRDVAAFEAAAEAAIPARQGLSLSQAARSGGQITERVAEKLSDLRATIEPMTDETRPADQGLTPEDHEAQRNWHQFLGAPRGAVYSCGDVRAPPPGRRSGLVKLEAA